MEFMDVVRKRRSIRKFKIDKVSEQKLSTVLEAGRWAPSAGNCQPWRFIVVTDVEVKEQIAEVCTMFSREHWKCFSPERAKYLAERGGTWDKSYMKNVPVIVGVCYVLLDDMAHDLILGSVWMAVENMLLSATALELGSCVYTFYSGKEEDEIRRILHVPQSHRLACMIQLGYASVEPSTPCRKKLEEVVSYERF